MSVYHIIFINIVEVSKNFVLVSKGNTLIVNLKIIVEILRNICVQKGVLPPKQINDRCKKQTPMMLIGFCLVLQLQLLDQ